MKELLESLTLEEARAVLQSLYNESGDIAKKIETLANKKFCSINIDEIVDDVFAALDFLDVKDLWSNSGPTPHGYQDPTEEAYSMIEEALQPFEKRLLEYRNLGLYNEEKLYCMAILRGIDMYIKKSQSEFKDWAGDDPAIYFGNILDDWKENCKDPKHLNEMNDYVDMLATNTKKSC